MFSSVLFNEFKSDGGQNIVVCNFTENKTGDKRVMLSQICIFGKFQIVALKTIKNL